MKKKPLIFFCKDNPSFANFLADTASYGKNSGHFDRLYKLLSRYGMSRDKIICRSPKIFQDKKFIQILTAFASLNNFYFGPISLSFGFPKLSKDSARGLIYSISSFCKNPVLRSEKINLVNFPFCFVPEAQYRHLYRNIIDPIKGDIFLQGAKIKQLKNNSFVFLRPCKNCRCRTPCYSFTDIQKFPAYEKFLSPRNQDTLVFSGGSLKPEDICNGDDIVFVSPAQQGDMFGAIMEGFKNIIVIDGYFYSKVPCTTFEIMLALENRINLFGCASIGALRAVELDDYGMTGSGYVYNYLKKQAVKPYHVVAQTYGINDKALTTPLINIIYFLESAFSKGIIGKDIFIKCLHAAQDIHFTSLTFKYFFRMLKIRKGISGKATLKLETYFLNQGQEYFDIKNKDAKSLLIEFRKTLKSRPSDFVEKTFSRARKKHLMTLYGKYNCSHDLTLPFNWETHLGEKKNFHSPSTRDNRQLRPQETIKKAKEFFKGIDITIADTSKYDSASSFTINIFFPIFYFLQQLVSSTSGNGEVFIEAMAAAYMELVERIPLYKFKIKSLEEEEIAKESVMCQELPQYYNWGLNENKKKSLMKSAGYVAATDIISGKRFFIPYIAALSVFSGTDGNASGNSFSEAVLYGIYELIERDILAIYSSPECDSLQSKLQIQKECIRDKRSLTLMRQFSEKGLNVVLLSLPNMPDFACIKCCIFDSSNKIEQHGSAAVRANFEAAIYSALHEAYMQYIVNFTGTRDDYLSVFNKERYLKYQMAKKIFSGNKNFIKFKNYTSRYKSINEELTAVIDRLRYSGIRRIIVVNTSPFDRYTLKSVKVIIPGLELSFIYPFKPSPLFNYKLIKTYKVAKEMICMNSN